MSPFCDVRIHYDNYQNLLINCGEIKVIWASYNVYILEIGIRESKAECQGLAQKILHVMCNKQELGTETHCLIVQDRFWSRAGKSHSV